MFVKPRPLGLPRPTQIWCGPKVHRGNLKELLVTSQGEKSVPVAMGHQMKKASMFMIDSGASADALTAQFVRDKLP